MKMYVSGVVKSVRAGVFSGAMLRMSTPNGELAFDIEEADKKPFGNVNEGDTVIVQGTCEGLSLGNLLFKESKHVKTIAQADQAEIKRKKEAEEAEKRRKREENHAKIKILVDKMLASKTIGRIDQKESTAWINRRDWLNSNRDGKEFVIKLFGEYFSFLNNLDYPYAYIKAYDNDETLGETKMFGGVEIYK